MLSGIGIHPQRNIARYIPLAYLSGRVQRSRFAFKNELQKGHEHADRHDGKQGAQQYKQHVGQHFAPVRLQ